MTDQLQSVSELLAPEKSNRLSPTWFAENIMNPAINAGPLSVYNTAADLVNLPTVHLKTMEAKAYSPEWFAQGLSSGVGAAVPQVIMCAATGSLMRAADRTLAGTALGATLNPYLTSQKIASVAGASIYSALQKPDADHTRLGNAIGTAAGFTVFTLGNGLVKDMPMMQKALAYPVIGFVGGGISTEVSQLASNLKFARNDQALQGAVQGMTMNTVMGLGSDYLAKRLQHDVQASAEKIAEARQKEIRAALERNFNSEEGTIEQFSPRSKASAARIADLEHEYKTFVRDGNTRTARAQDFDPLKSDELLSSAVDRKDGQLSRRSLAFVKEDQKQVGQTDAGKSSSLPELELTSIAKRPGGQNPESTNPNLAMGNPSKATADVANADNYLVEKDQYIMSYNKSHKTPNWVSWQLDEEWMGDSGRSGKFAPDESLPKSFDRAEPSDYTNSGYTRGHNCPSGDRTATRQDNKAVFLMSNMTPQTADNNAGPWEKLESYSRELAHEGKELYIVAGATGSKGTIGKGVNIPTDFWKVIVVLPKKGMGLSDVAPTTDVIAVEMPNVDGINGDGWRKYLTTVSAIERHTGYDLLSNLPQDIQKALESKPFGK
jgi:endonuclease G, mitochondrial